MSITKTIAGITAGILIMAGIIYFSFTKTARHIVARSEVKIEKTWELPSILKEISGLSFIDRNRVACIQDEDGILFIYNLDSSEIEKQIKFGGNADYEGVEIVNKIAYILLSDGNLIKIDDFENNPKIQNISTGLAKNEDFEGLAFDSKNNRLLLAQKEENSKSPSIKAIYAFDLNVGKAQKDPIYAINLESPLFNKISGKKIHNKFRSSGIGVNPHTGEIFLVEGTRPKLLMLDKTGEAKRLLFLNEKNFPQPEGLAFNSDGDLYISTEGKPGMIHKVIVK
ncbi:MAG TPA: SdiA-regulated domain-containing protein [Salinimicrobium sp.]|nr:SdiA-regulated domain-containing protein [Salinimicrobium sp.]